MHFKHYILLNIMLGTLVSCGSIMATNKESQQQSNRNILFNDLIEKQNTLFKKIHSIVQEKRFNDDVDSNAGMFEITNTLSYHNLKDAIKSTQEYKNYENAFQEVNNAIVRDETTNKYFEGKGAIKTIPQPDPVLNLTPDYADSIYRIAKFTLSLKTMFNCDRQDNIDLLCAIFSFDRRKAKKVYLPIFLKKHNLSLTDAQKDPKLSKLFSDELTDLARCHQLNFPDNFWEKRGKKLQEYRSGKPW